MYLDDKGFYGYKDSYNYYDIDVDKIIVYKKWQWIFYQISKYID